MSHVSPDTLASLFFNYTNYKTATTPPLLRTQPQSMRVYKRVSVFVCVSLSAFSLYLSFLPLSLLSLSTPISPFSLHSYLSLSHLSLSLSPFPISFLSLHISLPLSLLSLSLPLFSHLYLSFSPPSLPLSLTKQNVIYLAHASFPINHIRPAPTAAESNLANTPQ